MSEIKAMQTTGLRIEPLVEAHAAVLFPGLQDEALYEFVGDRAPASVDALVERYRRLSTCAIGDRWPCSKRSGSCGAMCVRGRRRFVA